MSKELKGSIRTVSNSIKKVIETKKKKEKKLNSIAQKYKNK